MKNEMLSVSNSNQKSLESLSNPFPLGTRVERLKKSKAINLENNHIVHDLGNGYSIIEAIDKTKTF
ncbi:hypothetical protein [Clostridium disporicum]|uniref:hypothetical protein n=1 Tax=Clostridium disporicum TaxID=84024 RepID=UPI0034A437DE